MRRYPGRESAPATRAGGRPRAVRGLAGRARAAGPGLPGPRPSAAVVALRARLRAARRGRRLPLARRLGARRTGRLAADRRRGARLDLRGDLLLGRPVGPELAADPVAGRRRLPRLSALDLRGHARAAARPRAILAGTA